MAAAPTRTPDGDALFFAALSIGDTVVQACLAAGYARRSVYRWRDEDPAFAAAWQVAVTNALEEEADARLRARYEQPVTYRGFLLGTQNNCPDALLFARYDALWRARHDLAEVPPSAVKPTPPVRANWWHRAKAFLMWPKRGQSHGR
jgi:hypothetical protein